MAYAVCLRARVVSKNHWRDNSLTGTMLIEEKEYGFKTRGHIAKAINSQYKDVSWKPEEGEEVITTNLATVAEGIRLRKLEIDPEVVDEDRQEETSEGTSN